MVPLRFPAEVFGFDVDWDAEERAAIVNSQGNGNGSSNENENANVIEYDFTNGFPIIELPPIAEIPLIPLPPEVINIDELLQAEQSDNEETRWQASSGNDELPPPGAAVSSNAAATQDLARNISSAPIQTIAHAQTTVTALLTPLQTGTAAYVAVASSAISEVQYFLLPDNRLVVDIHNAVSLISGDFHVPENIPVRGVRASQFSQTPRVTRVVFDVNGAAEYSISLSADRTLLTISFAQNVIGGIFSQSDSHSDTLFIQGDVLPSINISTEGFPHYITLNINNAEMAAAGGMFANGVFATHYTTGQNADGSAYVRVYVRGDWPSFSLAHSNNSVAFMMHRGISGVRYDSVNRELRISRDFHMNIHEVQQISDYLRFQTTFILPACAEILGRGEMSVPDGFVNSVSLSRHGADVHLTFSTARVLTFSVHEEPDYYVIRAHLPRDVSPFIVIIDPGHGGTASGTMHNGVIEKELALTVSQMVMHLLDADPFITAFTTRRSDTYVSLLNRTEFANNIGADLFVSIHANAVANRGVVNPEPNGIETWYTVGELETAANNRSDSRQFAQIIQRNLISVTNANDRGIRNAPDFVVLRETNMPSVLIELGFLTNPEEAARLSDTQYQWILANAIYHGIVEMFATHPPGR
jgi:N-acetylmuramoyl-L-alanine amidase